ncbi:MAG: diguanylate cyclase [Hyphomicrobiales bacterium]|jgi:diguanylate cyclase (GGDEF)-like protein|nr:diguanylate cyclase [Hyphomicrobiales bacterium]
MFRVFTCLTAEHDLRLVGLAGIVCFLASLAAINLFHRATATTGRARAGWLATAGAASGCGIWATHFIAVLAYDPGIGVNYNVSLTLLSLVLAAGLTGSGLAVAVYNRGHWATCLGGALVGAGVACMHYLGMWALEMPGHIVWSADLIVASVLLGMLFGAASLWVAMRGASTSSTLAAGVLLTLAIVSHHFTGMGAVEIVADPARVINALSLSPTWMAMGIANAAVAILGMSLAGAFADKRAAERIAHMAHHDPLTGLPNRAAFAAQFATVLDRSAAAGSGFAVVCIDLDRFKEINDLFGHAAGDLVLREVSDRLLTAVQGEFIARLGGDEFTIIVQGSQQQTPGASVAERVLAAMSDNLEIDGHRIAVGVSVGVAIYPHDGADTATLLSNADAALYRAKAEGRGTIRFFAVEMDQQLREKRSLQHDLRSALERGELRLFYQPQARTDGDVIGFEALARWQHPKRGMVPPAEFIPIAEESSLIISIGEWVLREACTEAASWPRPLQIAVNLSPAQFRQGDLPTLVHSILLQTGLSPSRLELEITEGVLIGDFTRALSILRRLKGLGVRIAMDDFGTGYSSLSYLQSFPFDKIKIDRSFIANVQSNHQSAAIVRAVIGLARGLEVPVVAEGVETNAQLEFLSQELCSEIQGYLIGRPSPIASYSGMIGRGESGQVVRAVA